MTVTNTATPIEIHPLTPERLPDFLQFVEGPAFAENPKWRSCYCQFLYMDHNKVTWMARTGEESRAGCWTPSTTGLTRTPGTTTAP